MKPKPKWKMKVELKKTPNLTYRIRPMRVEEIPQIVEFTAPNHFHFSVSTVKFWHTQDPDGMKIAITESGDIIGSIFVVKNTESLYLGGAFCVPEKYQHLGVGRKVWILVALLLT
ncbi:n-acetyltransferase domain-containing protein [Trichonephila inaurata madagascariensis]|uniref:N-acetyltransferase domain-containing protein n=1 Tax=Trichonephila inaurata madagascariensis TaxID=2747483 RepID=A0A8X7CAX4_9ARAC|nr:n-acetyltransferase domain-containing protein [Trichonephila inaurata madagascariensis]